MKGRAHQIVGDGDDREDNDAYGTPAYATRALLDREDFFGTIWEPACGIGMMSKVIEAYYPGMCISTDIRTIPIIYGGKGIDFLSGGYKIDGIIENIVTNPPYKHALKFVERAKSIATEKVAMLMKLTFLEGSTRYAMFHDAVFPLKVVYVFSKRLTIVKEGRTKGSTGMITFAWFVWERKYVGNPYIDWILIDDKHS